MATLEQIIRRQRASLTRGVESPLFNLIAVLYESILPGLVERAVQLATPGPGEETISMVVARQRARTLALSVETELARLVGTEAGAIRAAQLDAIRQGAASVPEALRELLPRGAALEARLTVPAVERMAASLLPGSPVEALFNNLPRVAAGQAQRTLLEGVALGRNPRRIGADLRATMGGSKARALTIARTEVLRVYRGAAQDTQRANRDAIGGWVWVAAIGERTCAMCYAMHGTRHSVDTIFASHPNCRCAPAPIPRSMAPFVQSGEVAFENLSVESQRRILGPGRYELVQSGAVSLRDVVGERRDPRWGLVRYTRSLRSLERTAARRR